MSPYILSTRETNDSSSTVETLNATKQVASRVARRNIMDGVERYVWVITGPAGCGKSTVGQYLAKEFNMPYLEGDEYHPQANIEKMSNGHPLTDADRWEWLQLLCREATSRLTAPSSVSSGISEPAQGVVMTCSALKRSYREFIRTQSNSSKDHVSVRFMYLQISEQVSLERVKARKGHYMKDDMVKSQFTALEEPEAKEVDCHTINVNGAPSEIHEMAVATVQATLAKHEEK